MDLLVAFENRPPREIFRWLTPGFRHCFLILGGKAGCRTLDPLNPMRPIVDYPGLDLNLVQAALAASGAASVRLRSGPPIEQPITLRPLTCVELVKRSLAITSMRISTPHSLFRTLLTRKSLT